MESRCPHCGVELEMETLPRGAHIQCGQCGAVFAFEEAFRASYSSDDDVIDVQAHPVSPDAEGWEDARQYDTDEESGRYTRPPHDDVYADAQHAPRHVYVTKRVVVNQSDGCGCGGCGCLIVLFLLLFLLVGCTIVAM